MKNAFLSFVGLFSLVASLLLLIATRASFLLAIVAVVNSMCLLLMTRSWNGVYIAVCAPALRCLMSKRWLGIGDEDTVTMIDTVVSHARQKQADVRQTSAMLVMQASTVELVHE